MDHAVGIVEAYLQINGYFTVAEYPVIEARGKQHFGTLTDVDLLAVRFPRAGRMVPGKGGKPLFAPDPVLGVDREQSDMLIAEVKEGRADLNRAARNPDVLRTVLVRFGCCTQAHADETVRALINRGLATTHDGHRVRLVAFGSSGETHVSRHFTTITLAHVIGFIEDHLREHW